MDSHTFCFHTSRFSGILFCFLLLIFFSCEKEVDYPGFRRIETSTLSNSSLLASAYIKSKGEFGTVDHGFIYQITEYTADPYLSSGTKVSLGSSMPGDTFATVIRPDFSQIRYYNNPAIYVRAYITDDHGTVYSEVARLPVLIMRVTSIVPAVAPSGDTVVIYGSNFNERIEDNSVTFNNVNGTVIAATETNLHVIVPEYIPFEYYWQTSVNVVIKSGTQTYQLNSFNIAPNPERFTPAKGTWNTTIKIYGTNLQNASVFFNDNEASVYSRTSDQIECSVPPHLLSKKFKIYTQSQGIRTEVPGGYFVMDDLVVNSQSYYYFAGDYIEFTGNSFNPYSNNNLIFIGQYAQASYSVDESVISFNLPSGLNTGSYVTKISNGIDTTTLSQKINIIEPLVSNISPTIGSAGTQVIISGTNLITMATRPSLSFGYYSVVQPTSMSSTKIYFNVPELASGVYDISLYYNNSTIPVTSSFIIP